MKLQLAQYLQYEAKEEMPCDASVMFFENADRKELVFTHNEVAVLFHSRLSKIMPKDKTVYIEVLDTETQDTFQFNARKDMHDLMLKYLLYPNIILNLFK